MRKRAHNTAYRDLPYDEKLKSSGSKLYSKMHFLKKISETCTWHPPEILGPSTELLELNQL